VHDQRFTDNKARIAHQDYVYEQIEAFTSQKTRKQLVALFGGKIPFGPVYDINDILEDDHYRKREMIISVDRPHSSESYRIAGVPVRMTETPGGIYRRAPLLGEHTDEILEKLGLSQQQIKIWRDNGIIK
jgi:crotonobetainyl-CoA:carnitine CoA-transferase CaiB-like acyl-CoA transferase